MLLHCKPKLNRTFPSPSSSLLSLTSSSPSSSPLQSPLLSSYHSLSSEVPHVNANSHHRTNPSSFPTTHLSFSSSHCSSLLKSCISRRAIGPGKQIHARLCLAGIGFDPLLATKLVNLYCICGHLGNAHRLFDQIPKENVFLWNVLIRGYAWNGPCELAISLYYRMLEYGILPDNFTFPFVLKACSALSAIKPGRDIHEHVMRTGWEKDVFVGAALIDMYSKCGCAENAREVFDKMPNRDVVLWNSMLSAYAQNGHADFTLSLCSEMSLTGLNPTDATLVTVISASADMAALPQGREIHGVSWRHGFDSHVKVKTALVNMYAKCGSVNVARTLFEQLQEKRVVSWNAMITGYAMHGHTWEALSLFEEMVSQAHPDHITFVGVLSACNHGGLLDEGRKYFQSMTRDYCVAPMVQHYTCMVDLLGHTGRLNEAYNLVLQMKAPPDSGVWGALLNSSKIHGNVELGELALERLIELEPNDAGNYVILSNLYAQAGKWDGVAKLRRLMTDRGLKKSIACSWIEVRNQVHAFLSGDTSHPLTDDIYAELERVGGLMAEAGYVASTRPVPHDVEEDEKKGMVCSHSERLAIAFGLISTPHGARLLVTKNLGVCEDCHVAIKFISKITAREITVRDVNRYHHFKDGVCSCSDFW